MNMDPTLDEGEWYVYSLRRARWGGESQYVEMIPKLFGDLFFEEDDRLSIIEKLRNISEAIKQDIPLDTKLNKQDNYEVKKKVLEYLLKLPHSYLMNSFYIKPEDRDKIVEMNLELYIPGYLENLIRHLHRGHSDMEYGIYFSVDKAKNDLEFLERIKRTKFRDADQRIVYYCKLEALMNHVDQVKAEKNLISDILYANPIWNYGARIGRSVVYDGDHGSFVYGLNDYFIEERKVIEVICQIPIPNELFKFAFVQQMGGYVENMRKYEENKKRYSYLKKLKY